MKYLRNFSRLFVGLVFIFSAFVKGVDPLGTAYRIDDYFLAYGLEWALPLPLSLTLSVVLCTLEFVLGISLLFNAWIKRLSWILFILMIYFTILTFVDAIWEPVPDCGCFGDAVTLSNWETFYKNIVLIIFTAIIFLQRRKFRPPGIPAYGVSVMLFFTIAFTGFTHYNLNHLPVIDFREWKVGNNMNPEDAGEVKVYLVFRNTESGELKEYLSPDYPWQDSAWMAKWEFVDQRIDESELRRTHDLIIHDAGGEDHTANFIGNPDYQFMLIVDELRKTRVKAFETVDLLFHEAELKGISFIVITGSLPADVEAFRNRVPLNPHLEFYYADDTVLKAMIRANPGLMLMKDGIVLAKWHYNDFPSFREIREKYMNH
jgi:hypothetical protein